MIGNIVGISIILIIGITITTVIVKEKKNGKCIGCPLAKHCNKKTDCKK